LARLVVRHVEEENGYRRGRRPLSKRKTTDIEEETTGVEEEDNGYRRRRQRVSKKKTAVIEEEDGGYRRRRRRLSKKKKTTGVEKENQCCSQQEHEW
jgi:hypothetical protein